ncbi:50S ribosomal protein L35 [Anaerosphaera multitolerans]|uniref:Large ribosomal subunit protein bL35 n=1 Tax=Anaerosphaera multitolerans TaxID=2487351 RepID=A0A437S9P7_9FIRM|nr:50S ribosomal protein L35 [Anaerosphaera multitolerans]RVU55850.1 50S ribosomal protein L35 [Anaerosphaera multitolerans]
MPKMKTHKGSQKRFKLNKNGKIKRSCAGMNHNASSKTKKQKKHLQKGAYVDKENIKTVKQMLVYKKG